MYTLAYYWFMWERAMDGGKLSMAWPDCLWMVMYCGVAQIWKVTLTMAKPYPQCAYVGYGCIVQHVSGLPDVLAWPVVSLHIGNNTHIYGKQVVESWYACRTSYHVEMAQIIMFYSNMEKLALEKQEQFIPKAVPQLARMWQQIQVLFFSFFSIKIKTLKFSILYDNFLSDFIQSYIQNDTKTS